jgi:enamine deaminase RidA (YjgF/YER057c/UK114 family)
MELITACSASLSELHLTLIPVGSETPATLIRRMAQELSPWKAAIVRQIAFGSVKAHRATLDALRNEFNDPSTPLIWVEGAGCGNNPVAGIQVHAVAGAKILTLENSGGIVARAWENPQTTQCVISAAGSARSGVGAPEQAMRTFGNLQTTLARLGMTMKDVARTWFYLDDILSWYGDFNHARNQFFERSELRPGSVPASTGVSGRNPAGSALVASAWAVKARDPKSGAVQVVPSPLQCAAPSYGSAFSRAVEINSEGFRHLLVSGTASIAPDGRTAHAGDVSSRIELSMRVVGAILESRRMSFSDAIRATAYFKSPKDAAMFMEWLARRGLETMPVVCAVCDICRDDLLFEIELDAVRPLA